MALAKKKSLGQNFLRSDAAVAKIVTAGDIVAGETVLEAGPGEGILTSALLHAGAKVIAVEKDRRLIPHLQQKFSAEIAFGTLVLVEDDILNFDPLRYTLHASCYKIIANIPYYITGAFIRKFLESEHQPSRMVLLLQKEVVERIVGSGAASARSYGVPMKESLLSVSVKAYGTPRYVDTVKAGSFSPAPKVDSAILVVGDISKKFFAEVSEETFFRTLKYGFAHKRKRLAGNLKRLAPNVENVLERLGIDKNTRAENLTLEQWRALVTHLKDKN